jgi:hypothetical protein
MGKGIRQFYWPALAALLLCVLSGNGVESAPSKLSSVPERQLFNGADYSRYFYKTKKWYDGKADGQEAFASNTNTDSVYAQPTPKWNVPANAYLPDKRMDEMVGNYLNLDPGRLEWNFNRL